MRVGSHTSHKHLVQPTASNQHPTGQNRTCSQHMKGCNIIGDFFFHFSSFIHLEQLSGKQNSFLLCWNNYFRRRIFFHYVVIILPASKNCSTKKSSKYTKYIQLRSSFGDFAVHGGAVEFFLDIRFGKYNFFVWFLIRSRA